MGNSNWRKRTGPTERNFLGFLPPARRLLQASTPRRVPEGPTATASMSTGASLLTVNAASRSDKATKTRVVAKTSADARVRIPRETERPATTIVIASDHAAHDGSAGI